MEWRLSEQQGQILIMSGEEGRAIVHNANRFPCRVFVLLILAMSGMACAGAKGAVTPLGVQYQPGYDLPTRFPSAMMTT